MDDKTIVVIIYMYYMYFSYIFVWQLYLHWLDSKNYLELTRTWYSKATVFPLTMILLSWRHRRVQQELMTDQLPSDTTPEQRKIEVCCCLLNVAILKEQEC